MEAQLFSEINNIVRNLDLPAGDDARTRLATNPAGRRWTRRDAAALRGMVWHQELGWGSVEAVARYHTGPQSHLHTGGVESIAYSLAIRRDGQLVLCNDFDRAVWAQGYAGRIGDENAEFLAVMFEGFFRGPGVTDPSAGEPTSRQLLAGMVLWQVAKRLWQWTDAALYGHFHFGKPACPGATLQTLVTAVRANAGMAEFDLSTVAGRQRALAALGYYAGPVDGMWGPQSKGALILFQTGAGLAADGIWGPVSEAAVIRALERR